MAEHDTFDAITHWLDSGDPSSLDDVLAGIETWSEFREPTRRTSKNRSRERRRSEILTLRRQIIELNAQRERLQWRHDEFLQAYPGSIAVASGRVAMWERMARHQFEARKLAETTNAKLRQQLRNQREATHELLCAINRLHVQFEVAQEPAPLRVSNMISRSEQLDRLHRLASSWCEAFRLSDKFQANVVDFYDSIVVSCHDNEVVFRVFASYAVPFAVEHVEKVLWSVMGMDLDRESDDLVERNKAADGDTVDGRFVSLCSGEGNAGRTTGRFAARRQRVRDNESAMVLNVVMETHGFSNCLDGVLSYQDSWIRLIGNHGRPTIGQYVHESRLSFSTHVDADERAQIVQFFETFTRDEFEWTMRGVESMLLSSKAV